MSKKIAVTQTGSVIGRLENQKRTIKALGLKKVGSTVIHNDTEVIRGMINTVSHLVKVENIVGE